MSRTLEQIAQETWNSICKVLDPEMCDADGIVRILSALKEAARRYGMADSALEECRAQLKSITPLKNSDIRLVRDLTLEAQQLRAQLESAQAACGEMREALEKAQRNWRGRFAETTSELTSLKTPFDKALSSTCGKELLGELENLKLTREILLTDRDRLRVELEQARKDGERIEWLEVELKKWRTGMLHTEAPSTHPDWLYYVEIEGRYVKGSSFRYAVDAARQVEANEKTK